MTLAREDLPQIDSPLGRLDPRWRLGALITAAIAATALRTVPAAATAFVGATLLAALARLPVGWYARRLGLVVISVGPFVLLLPWLQRGGTGWLGGSPAGARLGLMILLKALTVATLVLVALCTAAPATTLKAAHALRVPGLLVQLLALTHRYVGVVLDELDRLRTALRVRGYRPRGVMTSYRLAGQVTGTLLVRSAERAERVGQAMRCRGFAGEYRTLTDFRTRPVDVLAAAAVVAAALALFVWDFAWTAGVWPNPFSASTT